jgi:hypothetical protein
MVCASVCATASFSRASDNDSDNIADTSLEFSPEAISFLSFPQLFQSSTPERVTGFNSAMTHKREDGRHGALQVTIMGGRTAKKKRMARYFLPFGVTQITVAEDIGIDTSTSTSVNPTLLSNMFGIDTVNGNFQSTIAFSPQQSFAGAGFVLRQSFRRSEEKERGWWFEVSLPVVHIKNDIGFTEVPINDGGGAIEVEGQVFFDSMAAALQQQDWKFGKVKTDGSLKKTGVADMEIKFGYEWLQQDPYHIESFFGFVAPTGNKVKGEHLFEPIVGNGKSFGLMWGGDCYVHLWEHAERDMEVKMMFSSTSKYMFRKKQLRALDLKYKPWSRYIQLYASEADAQEAANTGDTFSFTPGINILTQEVKVTPGFQYQMNSAFVMQWKRFELEVGYNFLARRTERVKLVSFDFKPAIVAAGGAGRTNPIRDMTGNVFLEDAVVVPTTGNGEHELPVPVANYSQSIIAPSDLDLDSAATPSQLAHTLYGNMNYCFNVRTWPVLLDVGASYMFGHENNVVERWLVWGKLVFSY